MLLPVTTQREDECQYENERDDTSVRLHFFVDDGCLKIIHSCKL